MQPWPPDLDRTVHAGPGPAVHAWSLKSSWPNRHGTTAILVPCLLGPTGTGKTDLALRLASEFPLEISQRRLRHGLSAHGYRHGQTGRDSSGPAIPHHLIDIRDPWEAYSAGQFRDDALRHDRRNSPPRSRAAAGGWHHAVFQGLVPRARAVAGGRRRSAGAHRPRSQAAGMGGSARGIVADRSARSRGRIDPLDRQRIQRALEVFRLTGQRISSLQRQAYPAAEPAIRSDSVAARCAAGPVSTAGRASGRDDPVRPCRPKWSGSWLFRLCQQTARRCAPSDIARSGGTWPAKSLLRRPRGRLPLPRTAWPSAS